MGQQQLLLIILVTVIVAIAAVVALGAFKSSATDVNKFAIRQNIVELAGELHAYHRKPVMMDGGGGSFYGVSFNKLSFYTDSVNGVGLVAANKNGLFIIESVQNDLVVVTAQPHTNSKVSLSASDDPEFQFRAEILPKDLLVAVDN